MPWRYYEDHPPYCPDYRDGFPDRRYRANDVLREAKDGIRFYKSILAEEERKAAKKKSKDKDKKPYTMPQLSIGEFVAFSLIAWPFIGMFERWAIEQVFH